MPSIERAIASITEDRRADYLFDTHIAAEALRVHPNRFHDWWYRTREKLISLGAVQTGQLAAELAAIIALAQQERERREQRKPPLRTHNH